jgi:hypothetical protein
MGDPRAAMAAQNNADWYALMWDLRGLRYVRDPYGFRAIDPPPPYHGWAVVADPNAPLRGFVAPCLAEKGFGVKDAFAADDLSDLGLARLFDASWLWHPAKTQTATDEWEQITTPNALGDWETAWDDTLPCDHRQFPDAILARPDIGIWGRRNGAMFDAGVIAHVSDDCVGLSNLFGDGARGAATALCAAFGQDRPVVGYEQGDALAQALDDGWIETGPLVVWHRPRDGSLKDE